MLTLIGEVEGIRPGPTPTPRREPVNPPLAPIPLAQVLLDPAARSTSSLIDPTQLDQAVPSQLSLTDSLGLAAWQLLVLVGIGLGSFVADYLVFMRQDVRA